jgi:hypothetical protein
MAKQALKINLTRRKVLFSSLHVFRLQHTYTYGCRPFSFIAINSISIVWVGGQATRSPGRPGKEPWVGVTGPADIYTLQ